MCAAGGGHDQRRSETLVENASLVDDGCVVAWCPVAHKVVAACILALMCELGMPALCVMVRCRL